MYVERPDVVVVGLGPAGGRAAAAAAKAGFDVLAIDRRRQAGVPVQCAEFVPMMIARDVEGVGAATAQLIRRMLVVVDHGEPEETANFPGRIIDRARFDRMLAQEAAREGATCRFGTTLQRVTPDGTLIMSDGSACRPWLVIGADGPHSRIGAAIGAVNREIVETRQVTVSLTLPHDATDIFLRAEYRGGYGWLFPKGSLANVGVGVAALRMAIDHAKTRSTFGELLAKRQAIQWMLADSEVELRAARWLTWEGAWKADRGEDSRNEASIAKLYSSEVLGRVIDRAVQIHGGYGVSKEFPLERWYREARIRRIGEGPSEVHRMVIARNLLR